MALYSHLLEKRQGAQLDGATAKFLCRSIEGSNRMSSLVLDLLAYVQATVAGDEPVAPAEAERAFADALCVLSNTIRESNAQVTCCPYLMVSVKDIHLHQILQNLNADALKYSKDDEIARVQVSAQPAGSF